MMVRIFKEAEFAQIPDCKKGIQNGRRAVVVRNGQDTGYETIVEGIDFLVEHDYSHLPILNKATAKEDEFFSFGGKDCVLVEKLVRLSEAEAEKQDLYHLDRVRYQRYWPKNPSCPIGSCALPGSDIRRS